MGESMRVLGPLEMMAIRLALGRDREYLADLQRWATRPEDRSAYARRIETCERLLEAFRPGQRLEISGAPRLPEA